MREEPAQDRKRKKVQSTYCTVRARPKGIILCVCVCVGSDRVAHLPTAKLPLTVFWGTAQISGECSALSLSLSITLTFLSLPLSFSLSLLPLAHLSSCPDYFSLHLKLFPASISLLPSPPSLSLSLAREDPSLHPHSPSVLSLKHGLELCWNNIMSFKPHTVPDYHTYL